jgi:vacuolar-type H+-ATPase subunit H
MSTDYADTLKRIKDAEEAGSREVAERKKSLEAELLTEEQAADKSIEDARKGAEAYVADETESAHESAQREAEALLASTKKKADGISSKKLSEKELRKITDEVLFSEFQG